MNENWRCWHEDHRCWHQVITKKVINILNVIYVILLHSWTLMIICAVDHLRVPTLQGQSTNMEHIFNTYVNGFQAKAPTSSGLRAPTLSGQSTNMEEIFNTHDNVCQAKAPTSSGLRAPTLSGQSTNMETWLYFILHWSHPSHFS